MVPTPIYPGQSQSSLRRQDVTKVTKANWSPTT